ncbi:CBS domain-containing protein [Tardiphaga sp. OK245]|uniref:CBS domain-containing protein n=1 Tax=Tardiphaga sp. OK245 TaxID=1855306 RepID=UPI0008A7EAD1|nr:CBS domain-containing protein [Tardiphaga sp. OK245]SEI19569.1 BON domain-containing protein [Tardiphaga sp. OK245]
MRAHQIMTRNVLTVSPVTSVETAANTMLEHHISGLPVLNMSGELVGIVSERDFLRRAEIGTQRKRPRWLQFFMSPGALADDFVRERGRSVSDVMTPDPVTVSEDETLDDIVALMEKKNVKRLPVTRGRQLVGIITRANLMRAVASMARDVPDPTADDDHMRERIIRTIEAQDWRPIGLQVTVRRGIAHLHGLIVDDRAREASLVAARNVAGVKEVHDHLCFVDTWSGFYLESAEDRKATG